MLSEVIACVQFWYSYGTLSVVFDACTPLADEVYEESISLASWVFRTLESGVSSLQRGTSSWLSQWIQKEIFSGNVRLALQHTTIMGNKTEVIYKLEEWDELVFIYSYRNLHFLVKYSTGWIEWKQQKQLHFWNKHWNLISCIIYLEMLLAMGIAKFFWTSCSV